MRWSDGAPFNADDVVFSTRVVLNPGNNEIGRLGWDQITKIDEPDKYTVVYHMSKPYSPFIETFFSSAGANPCVLPKHLLAQYPNINHVAYNSLPVGIGPFKYLRWDRAQDVVLVAKSALLARPVQNCRRSSIKIIPDRNTLLSQLQAHETRHVAIGPRLPTSRACKRSPGFAILRQPGYYFATSTSIPRGRPCAIRSCARPCGWRSIAERSAKRSATASGSFRK